MRDVLSELERLSKEVKEECSCCVESGACNVCFAAAFSALENIDALVKVAKFAAKGLYPHSYR